MPVPVSASPPTTNKAMRRTVSDALTAFTSSRKPNALGTPQQLLGEFPTYAEAERLVDELSDNGFAVEHVRIIGNDLRSMEYVTGRLTTIRAALAGAAGGAWFGLLVGLLLALFTTGPAWFGLFLVSPALGAVWGGTFGLLSQSATRGRRDFASVKGIEADRYAVSVAISHADEASRLAGRA